MGNSFVTKKYHKEYEKDHNASLWSFFMLFHQFSYLIHIPLLGRLFVPISVPQYFLGQIQKTVVVLVVLAALINSYLIL